MLLLSNLLLCDSGGIQFATFQLPHLEIMDCGMTICDPNTENPTADENNCNLQKTSGVIVCALLLNLIGVDQCDVKLGMFDEYS